MATSLVQVVPIDDSRSVRVCEAVQLAVIVWRAAVVHADQRRFVPVKPELFGAVCTICDGPSTQYTMVIVANIVVFGAVVLHMDSWSAMQAQSRVKVRALAMNMHDSQSSSEWNAKFCHVVVPVPGGRDWQRDGSAQLQTTGLGQNDCHFLGRLQGGGGGAETACGTSRCTVPAASAPAQNWRCSEVRQPACCRAAAFSPRHW